MTRRMVYWIRTYPRRAIGYRRGDRVLSEECADTCQLHGDDNRWLWTEHLVPCPLADRCELVGMDDE